MPNTYVPLYPQVWGSLIVIAHLSETFKFYCHNQHEGEMLPQYLAELHKYSEQYDFKK